MEPTPPSQPPSLILRTLERDDPAFVLVKSAWRISYWESGLRPEMDYNVYLKGHGELMSRLLARSQVRSVQFDGVDEVLGFSVIEDHPIHGLVAHYCYVKHPYRRQHFAIALLQGVKTYTMTTKAGEKIASHLEMQFNPYILVT